MKRLYPSAYLLRPAVLLLCFFLLTGCAASPRRDDSSGFSAGQAPDTDYVRGVWLSFSELDALMSGGDFKARFGTLLDSCTALGLTDLFVHVRSSCDAVYPSKYFPLRKSAAGYDFDLLGYMVQRVHARGMRIHAWINPYRVRSGDTDTNALPADSPAKKWLTDADPANDTNVCLSGGIFLNPASAEVRRLILDGVRELLNNYQVDGIHLDDYFYPTTDPAFDSASYQQYTASCEHPLSLADWRRTCVDALIDGCGSAVRAYKRPLIFSVSPAASIDKNRDSLYADVREWLTGGCVDWIIPQLYFGFEYPQADFRFDRLLTAWTAAAKGSRTKLLIGLAPYKLGTDAAADAAEWDSCTDLLARQASLCRKTAGVGGIVFFSCTSLFSEKEQNTAERKNLLKAEPASAENNK